MPPPCLSNLPTASASTDATDVLLVQEEENTRDVWASALRTAGYVPHPVGTIEELFEALLDHLNWRAIVVDLGFRGLEATKFLDRLRGANIVLPALLTAWEKTLADTKAAKAYPGLAFISAPLGPRELVSAVRALPSPLKPRLPALDPGFLHKYEGVEREERERSTLLPEAAAQRAAAEAVEAEARSPGHDLRVAREMERVREAHCRLMPGIIPQPEEYEIAARYVPARRADGDYHDVMILPDGRVALLVADVSDKAASAAGAMETGRAVFHSIAPGMANARQIVIEVADRIARDLHRGSFLSLAFGLLNPATGSVSVASAGHPPPLYRSLSQGKPLVSALDAAGAVIGLVKTPLFVRTLRDCTLTLQRGEQLLFYSDGVSHARDRRNQEYGDRRLQEAMRDYGGTTAEELAEGIVNSVLYHRRDSQVADDITVLVVMRK